MEKDEFFANELNSSSFDDGIRFNGGSEQLGGGFFNPSWENSVDQCDPFESALSSMVSSPGVEAPGAGDGIMMRELIGKLGNICESEEMSRSCVGSNSNSANTSCYGTPLSSPSKLKFSIKGNLPIPGNVFPSWGPFPADPGFVERAARFSCLGSKSLGGPNGNFGVSGTVSQYASMPQDGNTANERRFVQLTRASRPENAELGDSGEVSSVSEQIPSEDQRMKAKNDASGKKRKSIPRGKAKETTSAKDEKVDQSENDDSNSKKMKQDEESGSKKDDAKVKEEMAEDPTEKRAKDDPKPPEPPKDYIHVRARRGQATDPHSLAERARREKISERMKFLQNLVPGCNKVTGKAVMLDEIINYVQSLQRQVEFLSMKLATVNPRTDLNIEALLLKDVYQSVGSLANTLYPLGCLEPVISNGYQAQQLPSLEGGSISKMDKQVPANSLNAAPCPTPGVALPTVGFLDSAPQVSTFWEDDLQSVVQIGSCQNQVDITHGQMNFEL